MSSISVKNKRIGWMIVKDLYFRKGNFYFFHFCFWKNVCVTIATLCEVSYKPIWAGNIECMIDKNLSIKSISQIQCVEHNYRRKMSISEKMYSSKNSRMKTKVNWRWLENCSAVDCSPVRQGIIPVAVCDSYWCFENGYL